MIIHYESPAQMAFDAIKNCAAQESMRRLSEDFLGVGASGIESMLRQGGEESNVPAALKLLDKLAVALPETVGAEWVASPGGAYPIVPEALAGFPMPMRRKVTLSKDTAPIRVGVVNTVSAGIQEDAYQARSAAVLAILMHLNNAGRAVELYYLATMHGRDTGETVLVTKIPSLPLSLAECSMALGNLAFARRIPFAIGEQYNGFNGHWPRGFDAPNGTEYCAGLAKRLGFQMILPTLYLSEARELLDDPAAWMLGKYQALQALLGEDSDLAA